MGRGNIIWRSLGNALRALAWRAEGAAAVEFAIITPVIALLLLPGTIDLAQLLNQGLALNGAVRAGAAYAIADPSTSETAIQCIIGQAVTCPSGVSPYATLPAGVTVAVTFPNAGTFSPPQYCTCDNGSSITCDNDTTDSTPGKLCPGTPPGPKHFYIQIKAVASGLSPLLSWVGMPTSITSILTVRVL